MAVENIMRRIRRLETPPPEAQRFWLADTMDWMQLWTEEPIIEPDHEPARPDSFHESSDDVSPTL